ncbi:MAG: hypothetical protein AAF587_33110 [Bacteroidota bacterium]
MKSLLFCSLFILSFFSCGLGQNTEFLDGYIVLANQDTVRGPIALTFKNSQQAITFRSANAEESVYTLDELAGYGLEGDHYRSFGFMLTQNDGQEVFRKGFVHLLLEGTISLYRYTDPGSDRTIFYLEKEKGELLELVYRDPRKSTLNAQASYRFNQTLKETFISCWKVVEQIDQVEYKTRDLLSVFTNWHECEDKNYTVFNSERKKAALQFNGLILQAGLGRFYEAAQGGPVISQIGLGGLLLEVQPKSAHSKWAFQGGLDYLALLNSDIRNEFSLNVWGKRFFPVKKANMYAKVGLSGFDPQAAIGFSRSLSKHIFVKLETRAILARTAGTIYLANIGFGFK